MSLFQEKFGKDFLSSLPTGPGVYFFYSETKELLYIGKAKSLRRRLGQYAKLKRRKKDSKKKKILLEAITLEWTETPGELEALLLETQLIQKHRPRFNISSAFCFLYPYIGLKKDKRGVAICYTTHPAEFSDFTLFGAFRSRILTKAAYFAICRLWGMLGHPERRKAEKLPKYSHVRWFRQLPSESHLKWATFWRGESSEALEELLLALLGRKSARTRIEETQSDLDDLKRFFRKEAIVLKKALEKTGWPTYPVPQNERDPLFLSYRFPAT